MLDEFIGRGQPNFADGQDSQEGGEKSYHSIIGTVRLRCDASVIQALVKQAMRQGMGAA